MISGAIVTTLQHTSAVQGPVQSEDQTFISLAHVIIIRQFSKTDPGQLNYILYQQWNYQPRKLSVTSTGEGEGKGTS